ncbi:ABC transporter substrate-binding protein [Nocardioidaceae bacterium SCSIO 66511]|nr:ABC transporter substrate-binding protein [Nocardioidaceae bacterium SCSIO 66511]
MRLHRPNTRGRLVLAAIAVAVVTTACSSANGQGPSLDSDEPIPNKVDKDTVLRIGDPETQTALELSGQIDKLPFKVEWANLSGGPQTSEAFRADALDVGAVADIPPLFAHWTGLDVKIVAAQFRKDPVHHPIYQLGVAPGVDVKSLDDLRGKKIAYSPGQAQGALVLRVLAKAGLEQDDVELVEMASTEDVYVDAVGSGQVDVAPLGGVLNRTYLAKYGDEGGTTITHGLRDDPFHLYVQSSVLDDADKAAALKEYVKYWARAQQWMRDHPQEWIKGYYVDHEGLSEADGKYLFKAFGQVDIPASWDDVIERHQETADLLAKEQDREEFDVEDIYDRRYEAVGAKALQGADR